MAQGRLLLMRAQPVPVRTFISDILAAAVSALPLISTYLQNELRIVVKKTCLRRFGIVMQMTVMRTPETVSCSKEENTITEFNGIDAEDVFERLPALALLHGLKAGGCD
ncbi:hypothetical protein NDU88_004286 [Pleurodeles waltl]|uniref:Uncharacterized protein n=1 Tax=Pleurodeles waltl TaxID=8319 RepID=A0AAV7W668_PLEWA|nr:hypothetical protein NDU88_004286 [Pleurodeles waltl]